MNALWPRLVLAAWLCVALAGAAVDKTLGARCNTGRRNLWGIWCLRKSDCVGAEALRNNRCVPGQTTPAPRIVCCPQKGAPPDETTPLSETTTHPRETTTPPRETTTQPRETTRRESKWSFATRKPHAAATATTTTTAPTRPTRKATTTRSPTTKLQSMSEERALDIAKKKCVEYGQHVWREASGAMLLPGDVPTREQTCHMVGQKLIAGGVIADPGEFPHMVALGYEPDGGVKGVVVWRCGGSLISELFVLTAAHCVYDRRTGKVKWALLTGSGALSSPEAQRIAVAATVKHTKYTPPTKYDDIALLRLAHAPALSPEVRPACIGIESAQSVKPGVFGTAYDVTGWGLNITGGDGTEHLMKVDLYQVALEKCDEVYRFITGKRSLFDGIHRSSMLCVGNKEEGKDSCQGDSGGPAQTRLNGTDTYCMYDVAGVTSFGESACGGPLLTASVYTRVRHYLPWIVPIVWPDDSVSHGDTV